MLYSGAFKVIIHLYIIEAGNLTSIGSLEERHALLRGLRADLEVWANTQSCFSLFAFLNIEYQIREN